MTPAAALAGLAITARLTRFLNDDVLAQPIRDAVERRKDRAQARAAHPAGQGLTELQSRDERRAAAWEKAEYLLGCPWCASIWLGLPAAIGAQRYGSRPAFQVLGLWLGSSYAYGLLAQTLDSDD